MDIAAELRFFNSEKEKLQEIEHFPDAIAPTGLTDVLSLIDNIIADLDKAHRFYFSKPGLLAKYANMHKMLSVLSMEMLEKRTGEQRRLNVGLPPSQKFPLPEPSEEEKYISLCCKYVFSAKYALEGLTDGWNKPQTQEAE